MNVDPPSSQSPSRRSVVPPIVHGVAYGLLGAALVWIVASRYAYPLMTREPLDVVSGQAALPAIASSGQEPELSDLVERRIDPNRADWMELTRLPRIGETLAKRIVTYRQEHEQTVPDRSGRPVAQPVFRVPADLQAVPGIGPKTVARIAPLLKLTEINNTSPSTAPD